MDEAKKYYVDVVKFAAIKRRDFRIVDLDGEWKRFYLGVDPSLSVQAGVAILINSQLSDSMFDCIPLGSRTCRLKLKIKE